MDVFKFTLRLLTVTVALGIATAAESDHHEQMGPEMTPEQVIQELIPTALQETFRATLAVENATEGVHESGDPQAIIAAELQMMQSVRGTLEQTRAYVANASDAEKENIAKALIFFHHEGGPDEHHGPGGPHPGMPPGGMPPGGPPGGQPCGPGGPPGGQPCGGPPDINKLLDDMLRHVTEAIAHLERGEMPPDDHPGGPQGQHPQGHPGQGPGGPGQHPQGQPGQGPGGQPMGEHTEMPAPPECSDELRNAELQPQATDVPVGETMGNLIFRTVCNMPGWDTNAITLPAGRAAGGFDVEASTHDPSGVAFEIRVEGGPTVYHSSMGVAALHGLIIEDNNPSSTGKYTIALDAGGSAPGARITIRFVDHPK